MPHYLANPPILLATAVDIGVPQLAMHSIREMCAVADVAACHRAFVSFFESISQIDSEVDPDTLPQVGWEAGPVGQRGWVHVQARWRGGCLASGDAHTKMAGHLHLGSRLTV